MEKQTMEQLEERMDRVIVNLEVLPVTAPEYNGFLSELRQLEAKMAALNAIRPNYTSGIKEQSTFNLR